MNVKLQSVKGVLVFDLGTDGTSAMFVNKRGRVVATSSTFKYKMIREDEGCNEQKPTAWVHAVEKAVQHLIQKITNKGKVMRVLMICVAGQMHGEVIIIGSRKAWNTARLWCDGRNHAEAQELTELFRFKVFTRMTIARWLWTMRNQKVKASACQAITTPAGWISYLLTGVNMLCVGEASGVFPIDPGTGQYDSLMINKFNDLTCQISPRSIQKLLPNVAPVGTQMGTLGTHGARLLGLDAGIPIAVPMGDQPAAMAGSLVHKAGIGALCAGTSIVLNTPCKPTQVLKNHLPNVDVFCTPDGMPFHMIWLLNGTNGMNLIGDGMAEVGGWKGRDEAFNARMHLAAKAPVDCEGIVFQGLLDTEPGLGLNDKAIAIMAGMGVKHRHYTGSKINAAYLATTFNIRSGIEDLRARGIPVEKIVLTGGVMHSKKHFAMLTANSLRLNVEVPACATEGTGYGAAMNALFTLAKKKNAQLSWPAFLDSMRERTKIETFEPTEEVAGQLDRSFQVHQNLLRLQPQLIEAFKV